MTSPDITSFMAQASFACAYKQMTASTLSTLSYSEAELTTQTIPAHGPVYYRCQRGQSPKSWALVQTKLKTFSLTLFPKHPDESGDACALFQWLRVKTRFKSMARG
jgi:hypothetical protein